MSVATAGTGEARTRRVGGVPFRVTRLEDTVEWVISLATGPHAAVNIRFLNAWNVALARSDRGYRTLLTRHGVNFPDGTPVVWVMKMLGRASRSAAQVRGPTLFDEVMRRGVSVNLRHYLLGGSPETLDQLVRTLTARYDGIHIVGSFAPPFAPLGRDYIDECLRRIRPCKPDLVWIGLGTPKQDYAGNELCMDLGLPVLGVGAAFDFVAGTKREAPVWMQRCGFEWLFRLASEPRRLWRRYLWGNIRFIVAVLAEWAADRRSTPPP